MKELSSSEQAVDGRFGHDKDPAVVGVSTTEPPLPRWAYLPINRCNLPAKLLGSLNFQRHPTALTIDGVYELHRQLFERLDATPQPAARASLFMAHMQAVFSLSNPEAAGHEAGALRDRTRAHYRRLLHGWTFDANGCEAAVLKGWVETCFGLLPRYHGGPIRDYAGVTYQRYLEMRAQGLAGTNAVEAQLDLLYSYCQYEFARQQPTLTHLILYRGCNRLDAYETLAVQDRHHRVILLNSLSSFTASPERAGEFGDHVIQVRVPIAKICFHQHLLPGLLCGEEEYGVLGGVYEVMLTPL